MGIGWPIALTHTHRLKTGYIIKLATRNDLDFKSHNLYPNDYPMFEEN